MAPLTIYKASAGSGKTYQLTMGYLELLFRYPHSYRHILAVTFTNKAASEMKSRILDRLHALSALDPWDQSEDLSQLVNSTGKHAETIISQAGQILSLILNDYSRFSVGTIDRFFQSIIRAFTREMGLPAGFNLELDRKRVLEEAIDRLFLNLGEDNELLSWMLRLAESRIEESRGWNFREEISNLGDELFSEAYQEIMLDAKNRISREMLNDFVADLEKQKKDCLRQMMQVGSRALELMRENGFTEEDFLRKSTGPAGFLIKIADGTKTSLTDSLKEGTRDISKWISQKETNQAKIIFVEETLMPSLQKIYTVSIHLNSIEQIRQYVFALGILGDLSGRILDITDEKNLFLLSDTSRFLKGLINNNPTPFIYEKTGNNIEHILLDEFQDTSVFQWENFKPLINHTLSFDKENIVVGDVKQSIYRWRNSDWKILAAEAESAFSGFPIRHRPLTTNWRSAETIVNFNNSLFENAVRIIRNEITGVMNRMDLTRDFQERWGQLLDEAYQEVIQELPDVKNRKTGYVRASILESDDEKLKEKALLTLSTWIGELQDKGYNAGDIAILVRTNKEGAEVAAQLMLDATDPDHENTNLDFVSNESLFLDSNPSIRLIISLLTYISKPADRLNIQTLNYFLSRSCAHLIAADSKQSSEGSAQTTISFEQPSTGLEPGVSLEKLIGEERIKEIIAMINLPIYEIIDRLISMFELQQHPSDIPYLQAFQEVILEYQGSETGGIHDFLEYWRDFGESKAIQASEQQDAIRIITIHKAKGLQFRAVILPFCDWDLTTKGSGSKEKILWCNTSGTPFSKVPVVPLRFKNALKDTYFAQQYLEEIILGYVDNLNLLYVALTRAEESMFIGLPKPPDENGPSNAGQLVYNSIVSSDLPFASEKDQSNLFSFGSLKPPEKERTKSSEEWIIRGYPVKIRTDSIKLHLKSKDFFLDPGEAVTSHLDFGNIMHEIFSCIVKMDDIEAAVNRYTKEGWIKQQQGDELIKSIQGKIRINSVEEWFSEEFRIINERDIIADGRTYRPDRVMVSKENTIVVDYKFGDEISKKHDHQVRKYMTLLNEIGYSNISGFVWYVMLDEIRKVGTNGI